MIERLWNEMDRKMKAESPKSGKRLEEDLRTIGKTCYIISNH